MQPLKIKKNLFNTITNGSRTMMKSNYSKINEKKCHFSHNICSQQVKSEKYQKLIQYWTPPIKSWKPLRKKPNFRLHIACVVEERLYHGLRFESELICLTSQNWKTTLKQSKPDILLMESIWNTSTGHWHMAQNPSSSERGELLEIISLSRKLSIPTVYWITKGHEYHEHFRDFAKHFDYVFCADPMETELLRAEGVKAEVLLPCVQPALYNPFRIYDHHYDAFSLNVLFDGWADLDRLNNDLSILNEIKKYGLSIIESRYKIFHNRINLFPDYKDCIIGCVTQQSKIDVLKYAMAYLTCDKSLSTNITQQWMTFEAAASRLPIIYYGSLPDDDCRQKIAVEFSEPQNLIDEIVRFQEDIIYREKNAHLGWRTVYQNHTFAHRIQSICKSIGINHDWQEFPNITMVSPTYRQHMLTTCLNTYERQTYPNKDLIVVYNENKKIPKSFLDKVKANENIKVIGVPKELFTGACMNVGIHFTDNSYVFKIDDDDLYGDNYVMDIMLYNKAVDADIICKPNTSFYKFEDNNNIYLRKNNIKSHTINVLTTEDIYKRYLIAGNSISLMSNEAKNLKFEDLSYGAADASYIYKGASSNLTICTVDRLNLIINRRNDLSTHTWKENNLFLMDRLDLIAEQYEDILI